MPPGEWRLLFDREGSVHVTKSGPQKEQVWYQAVCGQSLWQRGDTYVARRREEKQLEEFREYRRKRTEHTFSVSFGVSDIEVCA